ncbi:MAG: phytoene desaturase [Proteobacteria bacterium]|nr:phytoene desaturase [Pseudomonadota bacterium]
MAAALRLRAQGHSVTLVERQARLGGRAQVFERDGFRHDAGPTIITAPFLIDQLFELYGRRREDYVKLVPLQPWYRFRFADGSTFDYGGTIEATLEEIRRHSPEDCRGYMSFLEHSRELYEVAFEELATKPLNSLLTLLGETPRLARLRADRSVWSLVARHLKSDKLRQAFSIQPLLIGGNPFSTTSIYTLIHYLERKHGVYFAMGGTGALVAALGRLLEEQGVTLKLGSTVTKVEATGSTATGVVLDSGERLAAEVIVSNADPCHLYGSMVDRRHLKLATSLKLRSRLSMGLFVLYFGTRRQYPDVAHNTIWLGKRYRELLKDVFDRKVLADDFSLYLHRPTATDPSFAPPGCDSFYALCPVPNNLSGIDWTEQAPRLKQKIVQALEATMLPDLSRTITAEIVMTPDDFEERYLAQHGNGFAVAPYFLQSAWFRFHNRSESLGNLFLVGAGTHPGAGIPGVLCSAQIVADLVQSETTIPAGARG